MSRFPYLVRVAVGAVALAAAKGQELVTGAVTAPLTVGSQAAQTFIKIQQDIAGLAVRGDEAIEALFPTKAEERPEWASFDDEDDIEVEIPSGATESDGAGPPPDGPAPAEARTERIAVARPDLANPDAGAGTPSTGATAPAPSASPPGQGRQRPSRRSTPGPRRAGTPSTAPRSRRPSPPRPRRAGRAATTRPPWCVDSTTPS
ncbi:hypothetical protein [Tsukamurella soli]|uniref:hypothetical protein n=1 Tax=Tsukamurella soli TaxID=644556 RepID=UPI003613A1D2